MYDWLTYQKLLTQGINTDVEQLFANLCSREIYTAHHSLGVTGIALHIASNLPNFSSEDLPVLHWAMLLHDIGKVETPAAILHKPGKLTSTEFTVMKLHTAIGFKLLTAGSFPNKVAQTALFHHERYDGNGYPHKLKGKDIPLFARICSVADATDAMLSDRPYRASLPADHVAAELKRASGTQFDPEIVEVMLSLNYLSDSMGFTNSDMAAI